MAKKAAVLVVNPVNGSGLFQYLEAFFENGIPYRTFAVAETTKVKSNSGLGIETDDTVANLKGHEDEYDALVFACGDAMPKFGDNDAAQYNQDMMAVMSRFAEEGTLMVGHCAAALLYDQLGIAEGKRVALHPYIKSAVKSCKGTDEKYVVDGNFYTAQTESTINDLIPELIEALK